VTAADVKGIATDQVVAAVSATEPVKSCFMNRFDRNLCQLCWHPKGECKVTNRSSNDLFQFFFRIDDFMPNRFGVNDLAEVNMRSSVASDFDSRFGHLSQLSSGVDSQLATIFDIVTERKLVHYVSSGNKVGARYLTFEQQRDGEITVGEIAIVKGQRNRWCAGIVLSDPSLNFRQINRVKVSLTIVDVLFEQFRRDGPVI